MPLSVPQHSPQLSPCLSPWPRQPLLRLSPYLFPCLMVEVFVVGFFGSRIYYFIIVVILFYCDVYIILLY